jgi:hypothetical protein
MGVANLDLGILQEVMGMDVSARPIPTVLERTLSCVLRGVINRNVGH